MMTEAQAALRERRKVLSDAAKALLRAEKLKRQLREAEDAVRTHCRIYDEVSGMRGCQPYHLRHACEDHGLLPKL